MEGFKVEHVNIFMVIINSFILKITKYDYYFFNNLNQTIFERLFLKNLMINIYLILAKKNYIYFINFMKLKVKLTILSNLIRDL